MKRLRISVEGKTYEVTIEVPDETATPAPASAPAAASPMTSTSVSTSTGAPGTVGSPLGGNVVAIGVTAGQEIAEGDQLLVLEAMKMNTYIYAPISGKVAEVLVKVGDAVQEGQALIRISA
ncbi:MAG: biotin/lipoyl-containing protein [Verrucomicrobiota bacterium]